jgi:uncharacterized protein with LGFP repeats
MVAHCSRVTILRQEPSQLHYLDEITVKTEHQPNGEFTAVDAENYDYDSAVGWGMTRFQAIADLFEQMPKADSEREERCRIADRWDHDRKLRAETSCG